MVAQQHPFISETAYLEQERVDTSRHEYFEGGIFAMSGGTESHNLISGNTYAALHRQLRQRPCRVYGSDMRIKVMRTGLNTYPDVAIVCGQPQFTDDTHDAILNPILIVEVLSPSTERYDRGMKFQHYRAIESLQEYLLIAQDHTHIEWYTKQSSGQWLLTEATTLEDKIVIPSVQSTLLLDDVYEKVVFAQEDGRSIRELPRS